MKINKWLREILIWAVAIFILSNIINYLRKPVLSSAQLPSTTVQLLDGSSYLMQKEKPFVIYFWAIWCPTCKLEADNIERLSQKYEVLTIAVNSGNDEKVKAYLKQKDLTFRVLNDQEGIWARKFNVEAFPVTFIYNSQGELKFTEVGYTTMAGFLARMTLIK